MLQRIHTERLILQSEAVLLTKNQQKSVLIYGDVPSSDEQGPLKKTDCACIVFLSLKIIDCYKVRVCLLIGRSTRFGADVGIHPTVLRS